MTLPSSVHFSTTNNKFPSGERQIWKRFSSKTNNFCQGKFSCGIVISYSCFQRKRFELMKQYPDYATRRHRRALYPVNFIGWIFRVETAPEHDIAWPERLRPTWYMIRRRCHRRTAIYPSICLSARRLSSPCLCRIPRDAILYRPLAIASTHTQTPGKEIAMDSRCDQPGRIM